MKGVDDRKPSSSSDVDVSDAVQMEMLQVDEVGGALVEDRPKQVFHLRVAVALPERREVAVVNRLEVGDPEEFAFAELVLWALGPNLGEEQLDPVAPDPQCLGEAVGVDLAPGEVPRQELMNDHQDLHIRRSRRSRYRASIAAACSSISGTGGMPRLNRSRMSGCSAT